MIPEDIRDIRAPFAFPPWWRWPIAVVAASILALGVILLVRWWRRRRDAQLTPLERTRRALVVAEEHARAGRTHEWAEVVSEVLRGALAARLGAAVLPQTTTELASAAWAKALDMDEDKAPAGERLSEAPRLLSLLEACDLLRFARANLDAQALLAKTDIARALAESLLAPPPQPSARSRAPALHPTHPSPVTS